jgi:hypothetical protein
MKFLSSSFFLTILMLLCEKEKFSNSMPLNNHKISDTVSIQSQNLIPFNPYGHMSNIVPPKLLNTTEPLNNSLDNKNNTTLSSTLSNFKNLQRSLEEKIKLFEKSSKGEKFLLSQSSTKIKKKRKDKESENALMFYNSLSLIMLAMIAGGLVGVIFILYFSSKKDDSS